MKYPVLRTCTTQQRLLRQVLLSRRRCRAWWCRGQCRWQLCDFPPSLSKIWEEKAFISMLGTVGDEIVENVKADLRRIHQVTVEMWVKRQGLSQRHFDRFWSNVSCVFGLKPPHLSQFVQSIVNNKHHKRKVVHVLINTNSIRSVLYVNINKIKNWSSLLYMFIYLH